MSKRILDVNNLNKDFQVKSKTKLFSKPSYIRVLNNVSFELMEGETLSIVGESGCGKTTLGRCIVRGMNASSGEVLYHTEGGEQVNF